MSKVVGPPETRVQARPLSKEEVCELLRKLGLVVDVGDILAVEQVTNKTYRVIIAKAGVAAEVVIMKEGEQWRRSLLKIHENIKFVDLGVKFVPR